MLKAEIARSRRYVRSMTVAVIVPDRAAIVGMNDRKGAPQAITRYIADP
ncbi:MAG: hypothetical protein IIC93_07755 [Chloroflexi bacterium]|nr:hypothetical protein [Chloroflexota bacterium]